MLDQGRKHHREAIETAFAPQLDMWTGDARDALLTMLAVLTDVYVWKLLRRDMGYSRQQAEAMVNRMVAGVLEGGCSDEKDPLAELVGRRQFAPSLGHRPVLRERGYDVSFAGRPEMVARVERAGFRAIEIRRAYEQAHLYPNKWIPRAASFLTSPAVAEEIRDLLPAEDPDVVVTDQMFPVALLESARFGRPTVAVCHTGVFRMLDVWRRIFRMFAELRTEAGLGEIPWELEDLWMAQDRMIVTTPASLDQGPGPLGRAERLVHVGPSLEMEPHGLPVSLPWRDDDPTPLVLVSFSTMPSRGPSKSFRTPWTPLRNCPSMRS